MTGKTPSVAALVALALTLPLAAQEAPQGAPSPGEIVAAAPAADWVSIPAEDLLVMTLAPDPQGNARQVIIQLMPAPFSQGWVGNIRTLARAKWYDNISVNRVQDNYVVQWGDPNYDNPEATGETKPLPKGLKVMGEDEYHIYLQEVFGRPIYPVTETQRVGALKSMLRFAGPEAQTLSEADLERIGSTMRTIRADSFSLETYVVDGWPIAMFESDGKSPTVAPTHCYGMVGVGRNYSPDTGSGAELYTVIGHAPRHLDRNIALVGRVIAGMEFLSSLPRGKGDLGFYAEEEFDKRTPILTVRVASDLPAAEQPKFEYLSTESESFAQYADARANRRDAFFIVPAGGADICNIPVPVRPVAE
ncbi:peptidylprolyl isomerase [Parerythrobacter aurantius]|uniref:peptidylprolyl isomerase n=1 Tax=Parerythrobacter aurantius TaxID=3127706 RepID=UPI003249E8F3